jgi:PAS domain S-box-containing protein
VVEAHTGREAVDVVNGDPSIDLVLMDIDLGEGIDGVEAARRILEIRELPVVFLTNHAEEFYVGRARQIRSYAYVLKNSGEFVLQESVRLGLELFKARKAAERQKREYRRLFSSIWHGLTVFDAEGRVRVMNPSAAARLGGVPEDFHGKTVWDFLPEYVAKRGIASIAHVFATGETVTRESDVELAGETRWFVIRYDPVQDELGGMVEVLQITYEVTEQVRARERYRLLAENTVDVVYALDDKLQATYVSPSVETLLGYPPEHFHNGTIFDFIVPEHKERVAEGIRDKSAARETFGVTEFAVRTAEGATRWVENRARYLYTEDGKLSTIVGTSRDITDRKKAEEELHAALEQKDQLMSELNHRVKNNLAMVASLISLKQSAVGGSVDLSDLENQVNTIRSLHEKLQHSQDVSRVDVAPYLEDVVQSVLSYQAGGNVELEIATDGLSLPTKTATTLGLIISELTTNAAKHGFRNGSKEQFLVGMKTDGNAGKYVLTVSNTGREFPKNVDLEETSSLGLQLIMALTDQLEGELELQRSHNPVFTIRFPIST